MLAVSLLLLLSCIDRTIPPIREQEIVLKCDPEQKCSTSLAYHIILVSYTIAFSLNDNLRRIVCLLRKRFKFLHHNHFDKYTLPRKTLAANSKIRKRSLRVSQTPSQIDFKSMADEIL